MKAQLIHIGASRDDQNSAAGPIGGAFTLVLEEVWNEKNGNFSGYGQLYEAIKKRLKKDGWPQEPQFNTYGKVQADFLNSRPFSLGQV